MLLALLVAGCGEEPTAHGVRASQWEILLQSEDPTLVLAGATGMTKVTESDLARVRSLIALTERDDLWEEGMGALPRSPLLPALARLPAETIPRIHRALRESPPRQQRRCWAILGAMGETALPFLRGSLEGPDFFTRVASAEILSESEVPVESLEELLRDAARTERRELTGPAMSALARLQDPDPATVEMLLDYLGSETAWRRDQAVHALGRLAASHEPTRLALEGIAAGSDERAAAAKRALEGSGWQ